MMMKYGFLKKKKSVSYLPNSELESLFQGRDGLNVFNSGCITWSLLCILTRVTPIKSEDFFF